MLSNSLDDGVVGSRCRYFASASAVLNSRKGCLELSGAAAPSGIGGRKLRTRRVLSSGTHEVVCFNRKSEAPKAFRAPRAQASEPFVGSRCRRALEARDRMRRLARSRWPYVRRRRSRACDRTRSRASSAAVIAGVTSRRQSAGDPGVSFGRSGGRPTGWREGSRRRGAPTPTDEELDEDLAVVVVVVGWVVDVVVRWVVVVVGRARRRRRRRRGRRGRRRSGRRGGRRGRRRGGGLSPGAGGEEAEQKWHRGDEEQNQLQPLGTRGRHDAKPRDVARPRLGVISKGLPGPGRSRACRTVAPAWADVDLPRATKALGARRCSAPRGVVIAMTTSSQTSERRQLTVVFTDLVGSTELASALDPEDWHEVLDRTSTGWPTSSPCTAE